MLLSLLAASEGATEPHPKFEGGSLSRCQFRGQLDGKQLLKRWEATVTTEIWRRAARMVKACFPKPGRFEKFFIDGEDVADDGDNEEGLSNFEAS